MAVFHSHCGLLLTTWQRAAPILYPSQTGLHRTPRPALCACLRSFALTHDFAWFPHCSDSCLLRRVFVIMRVDHRSQNLPCISDVSNMTFPSRCRRFRRRRNALCLLLQMEAEVLGDLSMNLLTPPVQHPLHKYPDLHQRPGQHPLKILSNKSYHSLPVAHPLCSQLAMQTRG